MPKMQIQGAEVLQRKRHPKGGLLVKLRKRGGKPFWRRLSWDSYQSQLKPAPTGSRTT